MTKQLVWLLYEKLPAFCKLAVSLCQVKKISPRKSISKSLAFSTWQILWLANSLKYMPSKKKDHLQEFGIIHSPKLKFYLFKCNQRKRWKKNTFAKWTQNFSKLIKAIYVNPLSLDVLHQDPGKSFSLQFLPLLL